MINDKKLGIQIAENKEEALWESVRKEAEALIENSRNHIIIQEAMLELAKSKLKKAPVGVG